MPWTGYARPIAPNLTRLAKESIVFTNAYSISSVTAKSLGGLFAGQYPSEMPRTYDYFTHYSKENTMMTEVLNKKGIRTGAVQSHWSLKKEWGYGSGIEIWKQVPNLQQGRNADAQITSHLVTPLAIDVLQSLNASANEKPFFAWFHYMDPHQNYRGHSEAPAWGHQPKDLYDGEVWYTDFWIGKLFDWINTQSWAKNTVIIVTADHGEIFDEHHMGGHGFELWEALIRVPLIISMPNKKYISVGVARSHIDLAPTIFDLMKIEKPSSFHGTTLLKDLDSNPTNRVIICDLPEDNQATKRRAVIDGNLKWISAGRATQNFLFDIGADPGEKNDIHSIRNNDFIRLGEMAKSLKFIPARKD